MRSKIYIFAIVWLVVVILSVFFPAHAADRSGSSKQYIKLDLITQFDRVAPGQELYLGVRVTLEEDWHIYWKNPGDTGLPTRVDWLLPSKFVVGPMLWPAPSRFNLENFVNFGYGRTVIFPFQLKVAEDVRSGRHSISADVSWLICKDLCIPGEAQLFMDFQVGDLGSATVDASDIENTLQEMPSQAPKDWFDVTVSQDGQWSLDLSRIEPTVISAEFFPAQNDVIAYQPPQTLVAVSSGMTLRGRLSPQYVRSKTSFEGVLVVTDKASGETASYDLRRTPRELMELESPIRSVQNQSISSLWLAICFAVIGGVILNLMPCVLPVVAIKLMSVIGQEGRPISARYWDTALFAFGVVLTFCLIGGALLIMRSAGDQIGWGFQLQAPEMVLGLIILFFVLALNMSGLYEIGTSLQRFGGIDGAFGRWSSLLSGALVTIIATPCTAPFMGAAIGFSIGQGAVSSMLTFLALGVGMATPYVIISLWPGLFVWVPKPGAWMSTFKNLLSVPLYLTVIWLIWVLGQQTTIHTISKVLVVLVFVGLSVWAIGKLQYRTITRIVPWRILIAISLLVSLSGLIHIGTALDQASTREVSKPEWKPWSSGDVASAREEAHPVFVDYTAAWCITCQVNKALVLNDQEVVDTFKKNKVITFRADWTSRDAAITESLTSFGRSGVPVYVFYPANQGAPVVLSEVLRKKEIFNLFDR